MTCSRVLVFLLLAGLTLSGYSSVTQLQALPAPLSNREAEKLAALYGSVDFSRSPGLAVMVTHKRDILFAAGYGLAELGQKTRIGPTTVFRLASLSKPFTAMAIMILAEEGKLRYDDPVRLHLPELSHFSKSLTIRHLLTHTGGIPDYYPRLRARFRHKAPTNGDAVRLLGEWNVLRFAPGEAFQYSNAGYELLAVIVERVSKGAYADFLRRRIFEPLGMTRTYVDHRVDPESSGRARGYSVSPWAPGPLLHDRDPLDSLLGAGGVRSTLEDLYRWDQALYGGRLVDPSVLVQAFRRAVLNNGEMAPFGYGWGIGSFRGLKVLYHTGRWVGFSTAMVRIPEAAFTVIVLSNHGSFPLRAHVGRILEIYAGRVLR